ncbi:MAG: carboxypeptidase regulatory-like domain-containing protein, partial [Candidatus Diapherotrites archaeon]|nr:carboxypeptidase regulatory-like domain-containing protein [Candidatus Diapherotrites archaeon]
MGDVLKDGYFAIEDKWYKGMDWLDQHGVPVYKVIDPVDTKIPSFALFSGLLILGLIFLFVSFGGLIQGGNTAVLFRVVDDQSNPLPNVSVAFTINGKTETKTSDALGEIEMLAPAGVKIYYKVNLEKYEIIDKSVSAKEDQIEVIQLSEKQTQNLSKTLKLVNEVGQPILKEAQLSFECSTAYGAAPNTITGTGGTFVVTPNANCLPFVVSVNVQGYLPVQSYPITANKDVYNIVLSENIIRDASIIVTVRDNTGANVSGIDVTIQTSGIDVDNSFTDAMGTATFNVAAGTYTVVASDNVNSVYTSATETISVASGETSEVTLNVNKNASNTILVTVIDKKTNNPLKDATVKLKSGNTTLSTITTKTDGKATLNIADKTISYVITASRDGYIPPQQTVQGSVTSASFALDKATASNAAKLKVQLVDQDNEPVPDAKVVLYNADTGFLSPYNAVISDSNGIATFSAVVSGNYQAFAYKTTLTGYSSEQFFDITDPSTHLYALKIDIPDGTIQIHVTDMQGSPIPFARVAVYNAFKNQLLGADLTDTNGTYTLPRNQQKSKADKDVYLVVSKTGYATLTTIQKPVLPDVTQNFEVTLKPTDPSGNISIELVGLFTPDGKIVTGVGKGKDYVARFKINVPEEHDELDEMLVHIRTGEKDIVEKDEWYIDALSFPRSTIYRGSSWDPANGLNIDGESATNGNAKWANLTLNGPNPGEYEVEAKLHVRNTALPQDILKLSYKVYAQNGDELRDPADANPVDELYAATKQATYQVGVTTACDSNFCFDASILDVDEGRIEDVSEQFNGSVFTTYKLTFNLLNNGNAFHTNSNLRVKAASDSVELLNYDIFTADALELKGVVNDNEFKTPLNVGNFTPQKKVGGTITFRAKEVGTTALTIELVSDFESVFSKTIQLNATGDKSLSVDVTPNVFPSNIPVTLYIHAEDSATGEDQANALVTLENVSEIVLASKTTDDAGNVEIELPAQLPGKKIFLRVEKAEYNPYVQTLEISDKVLSLNPSTIGVSMNVKTDAEKRNLFTITNETSLPIIITKMQIQGNLKGFLDAERINSAMQPYVGVTISPKGMLEAQLTSILTPEGLAISEHEDLDAVIAIEAENYGNPWAFELPVRYSLGATSEVDDPTCFSVAPKTWVTSTDGQSVTYEFTIRNNCAIKGIPSTLKDLGVRSTWNGNELGELVIGVFEQNNPTAIAAAKARGGYFSPLLASLPAQDELIARVDFTPYGGVKGQGSFEIEIQATNPLEGKPQLLLDKVHGEIAVVNLADCIIYDKEILDLQPGKKDSFVMETKGCGAPIDVMLKSDLDLSTKQFTLQGTDKKVIDVSDAQLDQGQYPIYVEVEGQENKLETQNKVIRARIRDPNACIQLNRYEFDVYDDPQSKTDGFDTARLDNLCVNQKVQVKVVIEKKFMDSLKKGLVAGLGMFITTGLENIFNDKPFLGKKYGGDSTVAGASTATADRSNFTPANLSSDGTECKVDADCTFRIDPEPGKKTVCRTGVCGYDFASAPPAEGTDEPPAPISGGTPITSPSNLAEKSADEIKQAKYLSEVNSNTQTINQMKAEYAKLSPVPNNICPPACQQNLQNATHHLSVAEQENLNMKSAAENLNWANIESYADGYQNSVTLFYQNVGAAQATIEENTGSSTIAPIRPIPITGFAILFQSNNEKSTSEKVQQGVLEGAGRGIIGKISGQGLFGISNPFIAFGITTLAVALIDYFGSDDKEYSATVLGKDVEIGVFKSGVAGLVTEPVAKDTGIVMIGGEKGADEKVVDKDIKVSRSGIALNPKINLEKEVVGKLESITLTFTNISKKVNEILFRNLLVTGTRYEYTPNQKYKNNVPNEDSLKASNKEDFKSKFHLQFNTLDPNTVLKPAVPDNVLSCDTYSEKTGKTGINAAPRVTFTWNFNDITENACDNGRVDNAGNDISIYCDATQFSIATIQKVYALRTFIEKNAPFNCPIEDNEAGIKTQPIPAADIGISSLSFNKVGMDVNMIVGIENKSPASNTTQVKVVYKAQGSTGTGTTLNKTVLVPIGGSRVNIGFLVNNMADGIYDVTATIVPQTCENCSNSTTATDSMESTFYVGSGNELVACEPFTTKRLDAFIQATENAGKTLTYPAGYDKESILKLVNYRANLMQDRFSPDFFTDFDRYARKISFFNAPTYYLNDSDGLHRFFTDREHWIVNREGTPINPAGYLLPGPGIYDITLDINFTDNTMKFFKNGEPDATVNVFIEKTSTVETMSPFYSLPFNGLIGTDDGQGRVGYGINYTGEKVVVNADSAEQVSTIDIVDSTPVATLSTSKVDSYSILNSTERGNILTLTKSGTNTLAMKWSPSYATPVMMTIKSTNAQQDAYGFYSIGINNDTSQSYIGAKGNPWYGVGANCR